MADTILRVRAPGDEDFGASPLVEAEAFRVRECRECEVEAAAVVQDAPINT